ncbi:hemerythrin domain-containing protein [Kribbella amoyensis]|nr:hemerythrin domain-containing protein [Kribbella amoyensis]
MVVVHRVFRREFRILPDLITQVPEGDTQRAKLLAGHLADIVTALHHHHEAEDELLWPPLLERAQPHQELVHRMEKQHAALSDALGRIEKLGPIWAATARKNDGERLASALRDASAVLDQHMAEEEAEILPIVRENLTVAEWEAIGERAATQLKDKRKQLLLLGALLEEATPEEERVFLADLPTPVRVLWKIAGRRQYAAYARVVRTA